MKTMKFHFLLRAVPIAPIKALSLRIHGFLRTANIPRRGMVFVRNAYKPCTFREFKRREKNGLTAAFFSGDGTVSDIDS